MSFDVNVQLKLQYEAALSEFRKKLNEIAENVAVTLDLPPAQLEALHKTVESAVTGIGVVLDPFSRSRFSDRKMGRNKVDCWVAVSIG